MTLPGTFWFYSSVAFIGAIVLYFVLPETEGRTLVEIEQHYSGGLALASNTKGSDHDQSQCDTVVTPVKVPVRPKTDTVIAIPIARTPLDMELHDRDINRIFHHHIGDKIESLPNLPNHLHQPHHNHHHHHPLYVQNPRAYMRYNNRTKFPEDNVATVFSTHL